MSKSFREKIEDLVFAGLKPGAAASQPMHMRWLGPLREPLERFLNTGGSADPLYLTNRTSQQRMRLGLVIALPCLLVAALIGVALMGLVKKRDVAAAELTPAQIAAKMLPADLDQHINLKVDRDLDVLEVRVEHDGSTKLVGTVRNRSDKAFAHAEVIFDLADATGSRLGAVSLELEHIAPQQTMPFTVSISQSSAAVALVRDVSTQ
jgi:hypothetical protein